MQTIQPNLFRTTCSVKNNSSTSSLPIISEDCEFEFRIKSMNPRFHERLNRSDILFVIFSELTGVVRHHVELYT